MVTRRFTSSAGVLLCLLAGCALFWSVPAQAKTVHVLAGSFGSKGSASGQFEGPVGIAVNDTTHDVYVVDSGDNRVEEFNFTGSTVIGELTGSGAPTGSFSDPTQIAVDNSENPLDPSKGDVYVVDSGHDVVDKFSPTGAYEGQLTGTPSGAFDDGPEGDYGLSVAVDPQGVVWVVEDGSGEIDSFSDAQPNQYLSTRTTEFGGGINEGLAVDGEDDIYFNPGTTVKVDSSGKTLISGEESPRGSGHFMVNPFESEHTGSEHTTGVAVSSHSGEVYVDYGGTVGAFSLGGAAIEHFGSGTPYTRSGVAVDESDNEVYVADSAADSIEIFEAVTLPSVSISAVSEQQPRSLTLNGTVTPEGLPVTSCVFEYGTSDVYGQSIPCSPGNVGSGSSPVAVSAHLTGLAPGSTYHYRLVAENAAHVSSPTPDQPLVAGPILGGDWVDDVASSSATLQARVDPNGADTHYYFQYGTSASYGTDGPIPAPGVDLGSFSSEQTVSLHLQSLEPDTVYHYDFVVVQAGETFVEPDQSFTTQSAGGELSLSDGRMWELVSPPNKKGTMIEPGYAMEVQAAADGNGITYMSLEAIGEDEMGKGRESQILSTRTPAGWGSKDISIPRSLPKEGEPAGEMADFQREYSLFSPDLSQAIVEPHGVVPPLAPEATTERTIYRRENAPGSYLPLVSNANVLPGTEFGSHENPGGIDTLHYLAGTPELSHVVLQSPLQLTSEQATDGVWNLYEWSGGQLRLINILPNGESSTSSAYLGVESEMVAHSISDDGRWIAWQIGTGSSSSTQLYVRDMVGEETFKVGGPQAIFQTMSSDGSKLFFLEDGELYEFDTATDTQIDLTSDHGAGEANAGVQNAILGSSEDGSYVYLVAKGVLANSGVGGEDNLYLLHDGEAGWTTILVGTLSNEDQPDWFQWSSIPGEKSCNNANFCAIALGKVTSRVSPDGRYLEFMSNRSLTGYDNHDAVSGAPDEEVFLYDALAGHLACASCNPTGARPAGLFEPFKAVGSGGQGGPFYDKPEAWKEHWLAAIAPGWQGPNWFGERSQYQPRFLSNDGRLFFDSTDALVPQDTDGLMDVYEYEPSANGETAGSDDCTSASSTFGERSDGCVSLISSGTASGESGFLDASESGDDVFFVTPSRLTAADYDNSYDVYDAHACSSGPACVVSPVSPPPCTSGDSCKAAPSPQPTIFGPTPSATFSGAGNIVAVSSPAVKPKSLTRAQKLARALMACRKKKGKIRKAVCEREARKRYPVKRALKANASKKGDR
jgi:hypothetical protein